MKTITTTAIFFLICQAAFSQPKTRQHGVSLILSCGANNHSYTRNYLGGYYKLGAEKEIVKNLSIGINFAHTVYNDFPKRFHVYNFQSPTEEALLNHWLGITEKEWIVDGKGYYNILTGDILNLKLAYRIKIGKKFSLSPKIGISRIWSQFHTTGVFEAHFDNGILTNGKIGYDFRNSRLFGWNFGFDIGYRLNSRWEAFINLEDNRDIDGGNGFNYYEAKQFGVGCKYLMKHK